MNIPTNLKYAKTHEWVLFTGEGTAKVGITEYAQESLGSIVYVNLPEVGDIVSEGEGFGDVESIKTVSDIISPFSGKVTAVNEELLDSPEKINDDPYGSWLIEVSEISGQTELLDPTEYDALCGKGA